MAGHCYLWLLGVSASAGFIPVHDHCLLHNRKRIRGVLASAHLVTMEHRSLLSVQAL